MIHTVITTGCPTLRVGGPVGELPQRRPLDAQLLAKSLSAMNLEVPEDFLDSIRPDDIIEVYDLFDNMQIWRNFEFLKFCSYDLLILSHNPLEKLFSRDPVISEGINARVQIALAQDEAIPWNLPIHWIRERLDQRQRVFEIEPRWLAPVRDCTSGESIGFASTLRARCLDAAETPAISLPL